MKVGVVTKSGQHIILEAESVSLHIVGEYIEVREYARTIGCFHQPQSIIKIVSADDKSPIVGVSAETTQSQPQ